MAVCVTEDGARLHLRAAILASERMLNNFSFTRMVASRQRGHPMLRTTVMVLATVAAISGGLSADALARAAAHRGWDGLGDGGADAIVPIPARDQHPPHLQRSERRYDPWGHWGAYYGPMIAHP